MMDADSQMAWRNFKQMATGERQKRLVALGEEMAAKTAVFDQVIDMLAYHNQLKDLILLLKSAWETRQPDDRQHEWRYQVLAALLSDSLIFLHLQKYPHPNDPNRAALARQLQPYMAIDPTGLNRYLAHLNGDTRYSWQLEHLSDHRPQNMAALMIEFLAYAHREAEVPHGRTNLLRQRLPTYFVERRTGQLNPRQHLGDLMRQGRPLPKPVQDHHPLAPDKETFQRFLSKLLNYPPLRPYPAAALFTLVPVWLNFLQARRLLSAEEAAMVLDDLGKLQADLLAFFKTCVADPTLATAVAGWRGS